MLGGINFMTKKIIQISIFIVMLFIFISFSESTKTNSIVDSKKPVKVGVFLYWAGDTFISEVRNSLEQIQKENPEQVEFTFFDGMRDQAIQSNDIDTSLKDSFDLLLVNLVDPNSASVVINNIKSYNVPVILFNREPFTTDAISSYRRSCYIGTDAKEAGILQGKILVDKWNSARRTIDINDDNIMQYVMLKGEPENLETIGRTRYSIIAIEDAGIKTESLAFRYCKWDRDSAKVATESLILQFGDKIEVVIANNDEMAIGAINALQEHGYNKDINSKIIPVVGVDATAEARELIKKGIMTGSVIQDPNALAKALYTCGLNLVNGKSAISDTDYKFDETGVSIRIPYQGTITN